MHEEGRAFQSCADVGSFEITVEYAIEAIKVQSIVLTIPEQGHLKLLVIDTARFNDGWNSNVARRRTRSGETNTKSATRFRLG